MCIKRKKVSNKRKRSKTLSEVKPVENISKNLKSFLAISPVQKEVLISQKNTTKCILVLTLFWIIKAR